jgi:hypothetical protein
MGSEEFIPSPSDSVSQMQQMDGQPRSAPPDFIPELPNMERRQMGEPGESERSFFGGPGPGGPGRPGPGGPGRPGPGGPGRPGPGGPGRPGPGGPGRPGPGGPGRPGPGDLQSIQRGMRGCLFRFTYIWLINGNEFWFFPTFVDRDFVQGFRWRRNRWEFDRISLRRIFFFRCF